MRRKKPKRSRRGKPGCFGRLDTDMSDTNNNYGISGATLLGIALVVLKLCGVIDWSWWWVTCPFWAGAVIVLAVIGGALAIVTLTAIVVAVFRRIKR